MGLAWFFRGTIRPKTFAPGILRAFYGTPVITGARLNNWQASGSGFYADAVESIEGFAGDGAIRTQLLAQVRGSFFGLAEAGLSPTQANIAVYTGATSNEFTVYSYNGTDYNRYNYNPGDIFVIERIGNDGRISKADGTPFIRIDGVPFLHFDKPGCFTPNSTVRFLATNTESATGGNYDVQLQGNLVPF